MAGMGRTTVITAPGTAHPSDALAHALELMASAGPVTPKRMFGGHGLFHQGLMFGIWIEERLYFKVDTISRPAFTTRGLPPFTYVSKGQPRALGYHQAPAEVFDDAQEMAAWVRQAQATAQRAAQATASRQRKPAQAGARARARARGRASSEAAEASIETAPQPSAAPFASLADAPNLGPASQAMLAQAGLTRWPQVVALGAVRAYARVKAVQPGASLNLLWALEGALSGRPWQQVAADDRASLLMALEDVLREGA